MTIDFQKLLEQQEKTSKQTLVGLKSSSFAFWFSQFRKIRSYPTLIILETSEAAEKFMSDIFFFSPSAKDRFLYYPAWEPHPFDTFSPHPDVIRERLEVLYQLLQEKNRCVVTTIESLFQKVIPQEVLIDQTLFLEKGKEIDRGFLLTKLSENGYQKVTAVEDRGTFSVRGGIIDIFPPLATFPFRFEFVGDEIETIRSFDPASQRSLDSSLSKVTIIPVREIIYQMQTIERAQLQMKQRADEQSVNKATRDQLLEYLDQRIYFSGVDYYLPFFYEKLNTFFDYFSETFDLFYFDQSNIIKNAKEFEEECHRDYEKNTQDGRISPNVEELYLSYNELFHELNRQKYWNIATLQLLEEKNAAVYEIQTNEDIRHQLKKTKITSLQVLEPLTKQLKNWRQEGKTTFFIAHTQTQLKRFKELMEQYGLRCLMVSETPTLDNVLRIQQDESLFIHEVILLQGVLSQGFRFFGEKIIFITEDEIFGERKKSSLDPRFRGDDKRKAFITNLAELKMGDPIVHVDHGIGLYLGLERLQLGGSDNDYMLIEYADKDKLYLPVHRLNVVQRYVGTDKDKVRLDKLGGFAWVKTKKKIKSAIEEIAHELLSIYATREIAQGISFSPPDSYFHELEATFPYEETQDQLKSIENVISDMCSPRPMDRIICGDVGFGKTEVAIRAAFKAVMDKKQVALLAPTTLLVDQHYRVFKKRLEQFPVNIEMLSRFKNSREQKAIVQKIRSGEIDIIIGTHRLLSRDIEFFDLGLLIVDEEQRFGVVHKEKLKKIKKMIDVLTLSATPIPRTLHTALLGIRDISVINTPPQDRLSIRTYVTQFNDQTIQEAILQEVHRGGQVFFVHNRVETIASITKHIQRLVPHVKVQFAHGQMKESAIEKVMIDFLHKKFDVLVCTTIIGSGIDIPSVNTIVIDRADTFGLSQLYQLRGRVGRSRERAYAYLLIPEEEKLSQDAKKRLQAIQSASELGAGFKIASLDLEIRGGGNILGKDQSGHIEVIGFEMYTDLLEQTVRELKGEHLESEVEPEMNLKIEAYLPQDYISDMSEKITFYRELSSIRSEDELQDIEIEMKDRYGVLPSQVQNLFEMMTIKLYLKKLKVKAIDVGNQKAVFTFLENTPVKSEDVAVLVQKQPKLYQLKPPNKLIVLCHQWKEILPLVRRLSEQYAE